MTRITIVTVLAAALLGCGESGTNEPAPPQAPAEAQPADIAESASAYNPERNAYFGELHLHTRYSFDAYIFGTRTSPDDAYRFAKGEVISHPAGFDMQLAEPLDFQAVTDHAMYLGMLPAMADSGTEVSKHPVAAEFNAAETVDERRAAFEAMFPYLDGQVEDDLLDLGVVRSAWSDIKAAAERHNQPGKFTAFIGYEYTSSGPERENLHRNVIYRGSEAPDQPFSRLDSRNPEDLWTWMDTNRADGAEAIAIPHNSNGSDGMMFELQNWADEPLTAVYAEQRMRNEPLVEITQVKGTSDTHPALSPNDEWADFEIMPYRIATELPSRPEGSYVREAYGNGLRLEAEAGINPYKFGLVGASDTHVAAGSFDEDNYWSKVGLLDATGQLRGSVPLDEAGEDGSPQYSDSYYRYWSASGLAGVWAEENTREAIFDAFRRKETFATSGPRMRVRFFAGYGITPAVLSDAQMVKTAYASGVAMGSDLARGGDGTPGFLVWATRDPRSAPLQRAQIIKGWIADGEPSERVFDVACSDGASVDPATHRCPDNGATVNLSDCTFSADAGANELSTVWQDPDFSPDQRAFYYVRVLENPTCRWSTWDAIRAGAAPRPDLAQTIQERAWSSPIWFVP